MSNLSTKLYKLDFKEIIDNVTNRKYWDKRWKIFEYDGICVTFLLESISIINNKLFAKLDLSGDSSLLDRWSPYDVSTTITIPLHIDHYNKIALEKELCGKVDYIFLNLGCREIANTDECRELLNTEKEFNERLEEIAGDFLDDNDVYNTDIRQVYIDNYVENNSKDYTTDYIDSLKYNKFVEHRATFAYIMGYDDKAESIIGKSNVDDYDWILEEAVEIKEMLDNDDMEEFKDNLDSI